MSEPPKRPANTSREELGFEPRKMVRWFDPRQLIQTAVRVAVSGLFGAYSDKREIQAALPGDAHVHRTYADEPELWLDYVADLGDGWAPTYTVAYLLSRPELKLAGVKEPLQRGRVLVMGGDQVYPTASRPEYENRTLGPYRAAFPWTPEGEEPYLFAIPGNHDWYDGLTNFLRLFCSGQWIGAWRTRQNRSYFALQLPHNWWLWGVDIQFDVYIDEPQIEFFRRVARELRTGDKVILVTGKPSWKHGTDAPNPSYDNLRYFEEKIIEPRGKLLVSIAGDDHHYARYEETGPEPGRRRQKITSGGGGAASSATHHLEETLELRRMTPPPPDEAPEREHKLAARYPTKRDSGLIPLWAIWRVPARNLGFLFGVVGVYFLVALLLQPPVLRVLRDDRDAGWQELWRALATGKWMVYAGLVLGLALVLFAAGRGLLRVAVGGAHGLLHLLLLSYAVAIAGDVLGGGYEFAPDLAVAALGAVLATWPGAMLVGLYLALCDLWLGKQLDRHAGEAFAAQRIEDKKNFLRLKIEENGELVIYPIAVDRVARTREIRLNSQGEGGDPWFEITDPDGRVRLLEGPIRIS